jgi:hypothetical protein
MAYICHIGGNEMKSMKYRGITITFTKRFGKVWAKAPVISKYYIGVGKTKKEAYEDALESIRLKPLKWM